mmetsp:Transcript_7843/g.20383  ORF Transcript_7843/g.20383 Transcript_7843/m.20383 type:complete len:144 (-) Transcript_7843:722-1153(-)
MKTFLVFAAVVGVVASALPSVARDPSEVAFVEVHGPGFVKEFDLSSKSKEDKVFQPNGPDLRPFEVEQARNKGEEIDPAIIWAIGKAQDFLHVVYTFPAHYCQKTDTHTLHCNRHTYTRTHVHTYLFRANATQAFRCPIFSVF